ncbi:MAG: glycoside hydrolase family 30 beta sandwich domain-containing protein [Bacteroidia bacterium]|nr:glycoside hydrolase family 30 beta sandwich domain-containing protein [Bacteroidia bacterium]
MHLSASFLLRSALAALVSGALSLHAQTTVQVDLGDRRQPIDGFGAFQGGDAASQAWWQQLYYDDLGASIYRVDLTPSFKAPYSDLSYYSPWFMGSGVNSVFNLEDPDNPNGPENNRVRTYTNPGDYSRTFGGQQAPIAVMGPDIEQNIGYFTFPSNGAIAAGISRKAQLGDFKLIGSVWSPAPWVKVSSGNAWSQNWWPGPVSGSAWPFVWGGNFAGGRLDVSGTPLGVFNDAALGGTGPTSALTQFARGIAAFTLGYQRHFGTVFYAVSIQNELNFEQFYNSMTYPLASQYLTALKAVRAEFDKYPELAGVRIMGPEDLLGGDAYGMWQYGGGSSTVHKNLQYLQQLGADPAALAALDFFCIHGYGSDGVSAAGANSQLWDWWANGWSSSPAAGIPGNVAGFRNYGKKSWMTETSGENPVWRYPAFGYPNEGGWSIAVKIHQALTTGYQSAWVHWTFAEADGSGLVATQALTSQSAGALSPKYVAAKHFFKYIRPDAVRVGAESGSSSLLASAYVHDADGTLTLVLINTGTQAQSAAVSVPAALPGAYPFSAFTSSNGSYWNASSLQLQNGALTVQVPAYGVVTLTGSGAVATALDPGTGGALRFELLPHPAAGTGSARFELRQAGQVRLVICDVQGRELRRVLDAPLGAGLHTVPLDTGSLPAGTYLCRLTAPEADLARTLLIVR